jgi:hypothetical protein
MSKMSAICCLGLSLFWILSSYPSSGVFANPGQRRFLSFSLATGEISLNEPVIVEARVDNTTSEPIKADFGTNLKGAFHFKVVRPDGRKERTPAPELKGGFVGGGAVTLGPGDSFTVRLTLGEWFDFSELGEYVIQGEVDNPIEAVDGSTIEEPGKFRASLRVVPRDAERLGNACSSLLSNAMSLSWQEGADFAEALSHVNDPVAVPYLQQLLESGHPFERYAIDGLERVGNLNAVWVLIDATGTLGTEEAQFARGALLQIHDTTTDPQVKLEIENSIECAREPCLPNAPGGRRKVYFIDLD